MNATGHRQCQRLATEVYNFISSNLLNYHIHLGKYAVG